MEKYIAKNENRINKVLSSIGWDRNFLMDRYGVSVSAISIWLSGKRWPPFDVILDMAKESGKNISYILGETKVDMPIDCFSPNMDFAKLLEENNETVTSISRKVGSATHIIKRNYGVGRPARVNTMIALSRAFGVSIDYMLGLTEYKTWEEAEVARKPFINIKPGEPALLIGKAKEEYCLLSNDGKFALLPNGDRIEIESDYFKGVITREVV